MSIGLISENAIRQNLRDEIEQHTKEFLERGGVIQNYSTRDARFWHYEDNGAEAYKKGLTISKTRAEGWS